MFVYFVESEQKSKRESGSLVARLHNEKLTHIQTETLPIRQKLVETWLTKNDFTKDSQNGML
jgi:hypothetical protein